MNRNKLVVSTIVWLFFVATLSAKDYQVSMFGIKSDGVTLNTRSIQRAVDYISEQGGGRLIFYVGRYLTGSIELKSNVTIRIEEGAALVAVPSVYDYKGVEGCNAIIYAKGQQNIGIGGKGIIEGRADAVRASVEDQLEKGHIQGTTSDYLPALICMEDCENVKIEQVTLQNAGNSAFQECGSLADVNFPELEVVSSSMFFKCSALKSVYLPAVGRVESDAFTLCSSLEDINIPEAGYVCRGY